MARVLITALNVSDIVKTAFDVLFSFVSFDSGNKKNYRGAYSSFKITPGVLVKNSPLLAKNDTTYSFPGCPVSVQYINIKFKSVLQQSEKSGKWAVVFIPYREEHDDKNLPKQLADMTFAEVAAMPYAKTGRASQDLTITYRMRDKSAYCARPRELAEPLGIVYTIWDTSSRLSYKEPMTNTDFNCEMEISAGCIPHIIFGPQHRVNYNSDVFDVKQINSEVERVHYCDGAVGRIYEHPSVCGSEGSFSMLE